MRKVQHQLSGRRVVGTRCMLINNDSRLVPRAATPLSKIPHTNYIQKKNRTENTQKGIISLRQHTVPLDTQRRCIV
jgi:hypothetical protein